MAGPTLQVINLVNGACKVAYEGQGTLGDLGAFAQQVQFSPSAAAVATTDWSGTTGSVPGPLTGFNPADFANFVTAMLMLNSLLATTITGGTISVGQAFAALAERAAQT